MNTEELKAILEKEFIVELDPKTGVKLFRKDAPKVASANFRFETVPDDNCCGLNGLQKLYLYRGRVDEKTITQMVALGLLAAKNEIARVVDETGPCTCGCGQDQVTKYAGAVAKKFTLVGTYVKNFVDEALLLIPDQYKIVGEWINTNTANRIYMYLSQHTEGVDREDDGE